MTPEDQYQNDLAQHELVIRQKELHYSVVVEWLRRSVHRFTDEWRKDPELMCERFKKQMQSEIEMSRSCDAPTKPNSQYANNH